MKLSIYNVIYFSFSILLSNLFRVECNNYTSKNEIAKTQILLLLKKKYPNLIIQNPEMRKKIKSLNINYFKK
jgi:hypothetical protein